MLPEEAKQRKRQIFVVYACMCIVWLSYMFNHQVPAEQKRQQSAKAIISSLQKTENHRKLDAVEEPKVAATVSVKPLPIEETVYDDYDPYEEEEVVEKAEVEAEEKIDFVSAETITSRQNVAEGEERGTFFLERKPAIEYTDEDLYILANGIYSEAGICSDMECYRVGQVILDRKLDTTGRFPQDSFKGVMYASGQFGCVGGKAWRHGPTERELSIAKDLLEGARVFPEDIVWFNNKHDYGFLYCRPEYHYFSGYEDHGGDLAKQPQTTEVENVAEVTEIAEVEVEETETIVEIAEVETTETNEEVLVTDEVSTEVEIVAEAETEVTEVPAEEEQVENVDQKPSFDYMLAMYNN